MENVFPQHTPVATGSRPRVIRLLLALLLATTGVWFSSRAMGSANLLPHWYCLAGNTRLLWTTVLADFFIGAAYMVISAGLVRILLRAGRDLPYQGFFWAFGLFIASCGFTHFMEVVTIWQPVYWLAAAVKTVTAVSSVGTAVALAVAAGDIVAFVRAAREVAASRGSDRFRALFMATPLAILTFDLDGEITSFSPGAEKTFGFAEIDVLGKLNPTIPAELLGEHRKLLQSTLDGSIITGFETVRKRRDGTTLPVNICAAPLYGTEGRQTGMMAAIEDISERKRLEYELREKSAVLLTVAQALNLYLESGDWKAASLELLSFAMQQTRSERGLLAVALDSTTLRILTSDGRSWDLQMQPLFQAGRRARNAYQRDLAALFEEVIFSGHIVISNDGLCDPKSCGAPADFPPLESFLGVPIYKGNEVAGLIAVADRVSGYSGREWSSLETMSRALGILYDNYRQSLKRAALEEKHSALEAHVRQSQNLDLLARVAGGFAHDFNNLLMVLSGAAELLDRSLGPESLSSMYVDQIQQSTAKAAAITRQLLAFSRKQVLDIQPVDMHAALAQSKSILEHLLGAKIELEFSAAASRCWIRSDLAQILQVIVNLASNSRDAMPQGGRLRIATRNSEQPPEGEGKSGNAPEGWLVLEVRDSGTGIDRETQAHIFEPFFTTKPVGQGTGLGLSTVYGVVRQSGGFIRVESEPGHGACFEIYFPAIAGPLPARVPAVQEAAQPRESATILLVDDEAPLVHAIGEFLRECGYIVLDAFSPADALEQAREHPGKIDILVSDVVMPGLRGPELHQQILQHQPEIHALFMSGYAEGLQETNLPDGAQFLQKPFRFATLLERLRQFGASNHGSGT